MPRLQIRVACIALAGALSACAEPALERFELRQVHMGTEARLVFHAADRRVAERAAAAAFQRIAGLDSVLSDYRPDSELSRLGEHAGSGAVSVGEDLFRVVSRAIAVARATGGAFDPTIGPASRLWRDARRTGRPPDGAALRSALARVGWQRVALDSAARTIALERPGMRLDLGGIGKGYAADAALAALRAAGVRRALVAFGGEIVAGDAPPGARGWRIDGAGDGELWLRAAALATSGDAEQFLEIEGERRSHVLDPRTGQGLRGGGAVVLAADGATADALATAAATADRATAERWVAAFGARLIAHAAPAGG